MKSSDVLFENMAATLLMSIGVYNSSFKNKILPCILLSTWVRSYGLEFQFYVDIMIKSWENSRQKITLLKLSDACGMRCL